MTSELEGAGHIQPIEIRSMTDIADAISRGLERGALLIDESNLCQEFFDLRSGLAGEQFQKAVNYGTPLAIVISDPQKYGDRFNELVHEHRRHALVRFFPTDFEARKWLDEVTARSTPHPAPGTDP